MKTHLPYLELLDGVRLALAVPPSHQRSLLSAVNVAGTSIIWGGVSCPPDAAIDPCQCGSQYAAGGTPADGC